MPHSHEKSPEPTAELPNPDLNPLLNPTLGRNLGRWAEVYFTSPPEKREEAVVELLRVLKAEPGHALEASDRQVEPRAPLATSDLLTSAPTVQCAECGHQYFTPQRFCGMCGAPLGSEQAGPEKYPGEGVVPAGMPHAPQSLLGQAPVFGSKPPSSIARATFDDSTEITWLREKNLAGGTDSSGGVRRLAPAALALVAIAILIYAQSRPQSSQPRPATLAPSASRVENRAQPQTASPAPAPAQAALPGLPTSPDDSTGKVAASNTAGSSDTSKSPAAANITAATLSQKQGASQENRVPPSPWAANSPAPARPVNAPVGQGEANATSPTNGSEELALATDYLNGKRGPRDSAEAAKFLWKAVGKENPSAILLLSDMYLVGDGVPKSCTQARLLLNAAARKNVPQAAHKLHNLITSGCP